MGSPAPPSVGCAASRSRDFLATSTIERPSLSHLGRVSLSPMCIVLSRFAPFHQTTDFRITRCVSSLRLDCRAPSRVLPLFPFRHLTCVYRFVFLSFCILPPMVGRSEFIRAINSTYHVTRILAVLFSLFLFFSRPFSCHVACRLSSDSSRLFRDQSASHRGMQIFVGSIGFRLASYRAVGVGGL